MPSATQGALGSEGGGWEQGDQPHPSVFGGGRSGSRNKSLAGRGNVRGQHPGLVFGFVTGPVPAQVSHKESWPSTVPPPDDPSLLPTKMTQPHSEAPTLPLCCCKRSRVMEGVSSYQDRTARCLDAETVQLSSFLLGSSVTFTTEPYHPHLSPPSPQPHFVSSPGVVGGFGVPHPGHPSSASPNSPHNTFLCLSHYLPLPQAPMATTGPACYPRDSLGQSGRPLGAPSLSKEVCPPGLGDSQMMRWPRSQVTALSHHSLGSAAADGHRCPGPSMPTQRRELVPSVCHHPRGRDPGSHPSQPAPITTAAPPGRRSLGAARR